MSPGNAKQKMGNWRWLLSFYSERQFLYLAKIFKTFVVFLKYIFVTSQPQTSVYKLLSYLTEQHKALHACATDAT